MKLLQVKRFVSILFMLILSFVVLTTCSTSKKAGKSKTSKLFHIPKKVEKADDLPEHLRNSQSKTEHIVQLFPDAKPEISQKGETAVADVVANKDAIEANKTKSDYVEEIIRPFTGGAKKPIYYHIVSGSFLTKLYAEMFVRRLQVMGYVNTYMKFADNGFYRVIVQKYPNEVEARQYLQGYRDDNPQYATAWLFYKRNTGDNGQLSFYQYN
ncbi:MAG: hypothetical protein GXO81_05710 [Chlorobi bacterium]|nr:hypothetical protein [Chlorobiota bacterium]